MARFHAGSVRAEVRARYGIDRSLAERTAHERLTRICFVDYDRQFALVAEAPVLGGKRPSSPASPACRGSTPPTIGSSR